MIFLTGDLHRNISRLDIENFPQQQNLTKNDYLIVLGDFGLIWDGGKLENELLDELNKKNFTTLFIDGNHENFELLNQYKTEEWKGGKIHKIRNSVFHLMRGEIFNIDKKTFFTMGGASSIDKHLRKENVSWWKEELPSKEEIEYAFSNIYAYQECGVDYILSHSYLNSFENRIFGKSESTRLSDLFSYIDIFVNHKKWYFGHYHMDKDFVTSRCLYRDIIKVGE